MPEIDKVIKGLHVIGGWITDRLGIEQARNFLQTIDDALELLKDQRNTINQLEYNLAVTQDNLCFYINGNN